jgi:hypothetical protein
MLPCKLSKVFSGSPHESLDCKQVILQCSGPPVIALYHSTQETPFCWTSEYIPFQTLYWKRGLWKGQRDTVHSVDGSHYFLHPVLVVSTRQSTVSVSGRNDNDVFAALVLVFWLFSVLLLLCSWGAGNWTPCFVLLGKCSTTDCLNLVTWFGRLFPSV